jgi:uncharacterized membrane protein
LESDVKFNVMHWHPMIVHFPLALVLTATACLAVSRMVSRTPTALSLASVGTWNLALGAIGALVALASGLAAVFAISLPPTAVDAKHSLRLHEACAVFSALIILALAVWRAFAHRASIRPSWSFLALLLLASLLLIVTGFYGGENVFHYGLAVEGKIS